MPAKKPSTKIARVDKATPQAQLFKVLQNQPNEARSRLKTEMTFKGRQGKPDTVVSFVGPYQLDDYDQRTYMALVAMMSIDHNELTPHDKGLDEKGLWEQFLPTLGPDHQIAPYIKTNTHELAINAGYVWGKDVKERIHASLERLSMVTARFQLGMKVMSSTMISYSLDKENGKISVAVSPLLASAIFADARQFIKYNVEEMRSLKKRAATILHLYFTARHTGKSPSAPYKFDTLAEVVYGPAKDKQQQRDRRKPILQALLELETLSLWSIAINNETHRVVVTIMKEEELLKQFQNPEKVTKALSE